MKEICYFSIMGIELEGELTANRSKNYKLKIADLQIDNQISPNSGPDSIILS